MEDRTLSHYRLRDRLGGGGMGVVYRAEDVRLKRVVALKFLSRELTRDYEARQRFEQEAQAASSLDHPNICTIYEIDRTSEDELFIAMAYCDGETLATRLQRGPLSIGDALDVATQIARGLEKAHHAGIVHRDIKPANVMITADGLVKVVDFGIAKLVDHTHLTRTGTILGTLAYIAPEQISATATDHRVDIWALGTLLYEMLTGTQPFAGDHELSVIHHILDDEPPPLTRLRPEASGQLAEVVQRALAKRPNDRYASAADLIRDLASCRANLAGPVLDAAHAATARQVSRRSMVVTALVAAVLVGVPVAWLLNRNAAVLRAERGIEEVTRLAGTDEYASALASAEAVAAIIPDDDRLTALWERISVRRPITTDPAGADVYMKGFADVDGAWRSLGRTPIASARLPRGVFRWKVEKAGFRTREFIAVSQQAATGTNIRLTRQDAAAPGMIMVPASNLSLTLTGYPHANTIPAGDFLIDAHEVTNKQFKAFVDSGGYAQRRYWKQKFIKSGREVPWEQAIAEFTDRTGRPGPATWEVGVYPAGHDAHPVGGVSWYEAAAYAEFAGKSLPTIYHWLEAASVRLAAYITPLSNVDGTGPAAVGSSPGVSSIGASDMSGNVKEWCWNETAPGVARYILGGSWSDPHYMFFQVAARSPFDRSETNGFRLVEYAEDRPPTEALTRPIEPPARDVSQQKPVSDEVFQVYRDLYSYDRHALDQMVESVDTTAAHWVKEKVSFRAAYSNERVTAYLFLPKNGRPPYQTVVYFPGADAIQSGSSDTLPTASIDFLVLGGRAVLFPIYKGTYERNDGRTFAEYWPSMSRVYRDYMFQAVNDVQRSVDYLQSRQDIQHGALIFAGSSWGAAVGTRLLAVDSRFKVGVFMAGGFNSVGTLPEVDAVNFVPRVTIPILMINGESDFIFPLESAQKPFMSRLGTPAEHKRHSVYPGGHDLMAQLRSRVVREVLDWLDRYAGPVE
ncbi:MAG TPA: protein kinase [Vicinamibacterales bacterium]|nr:protein kinase [Vicinamibacterales bacterium]